MGRDRWAMTVGWADDDVEFARRLDENELTMQAVVYTRHGSDEPLALGLIIVENWTHRIASFHGGGWGTPWDSYDCARLLLAAMRETGWRVVTTVACDNKRAQRFVSSLGLQHYRTAKGRRHYRLC